MALWAPLWAGGALTWDLLHAPRRLPITRALSFGLAWSWLETIGVTAATALWATRRSDRVDLHYDLQRWWAARLVDSLKILCGLRVEIDGLEALAPGPVVVCARHASLADALLPAWLLGQVGPLRPRYVIKRELLVDPCLDIVGQRVPNHFVDRDPEDSVAELSALRALAHGMGPQDAAVIFPEGRVANDRSRARAQTRLVERDRVRAERLAGLRHLIAPRPGGTLALLDGTPDADVVFLNHVGLEGLDRIADAAGRLPLETPVRVTIERVSRRDVPNRGGFRSWLDDRWLGMDDWVEAQQSGAGR